MKTEKLKLKANYWEYTQLVALVKESIDNLCHALDPLCLMVLYGIQDTLEKQFYIRYRAHRDGLKNAGTLTLTTAEVYALHKAIRTSSTLPSGYFIKLDQHLLNCGIKTNN
jgi:hypothetical protein